RPAGSPWRNAVSMLALICFALVTTIHAASRSPIAALRLTAVAPPVRAVVGPIVCDEGKTATRAAAAFAPAGPAPATAQSRTRAASAQDRGTDVRGPRSLMTPTTQYPSRERINSQRSARDVRGAAVGAEDEIALAVRHV